MAKGKKKKKVSGVRRRPRRMSGTSMLMNAGLKLAGAAIGAGVGVFINSTVKTSFASMPTYTGGFVDIGLGIGGLAFGGGSPFADGAAVGLMGIGSVFVVNETVLSLPGISGIPQGVPNARPIPGNYLSNAVAGYRGINVRPGMGNMSGANGRSVAGMGQLFRN